MYFATGSSSLILPSWISVHRDHRGDRLGQRRQAEDGLVCDRRLRHRVLGAEDLVIDRLAMLLDQDVGAGNLAGRDLVLEELGDFRQLLRIEMRAGRNIESAFGMYRGRSQQQRASRQRAQHMTRIHRTPPRNSRRSVAAVSVGTRAADPSQEPFHASGRCRERSSKISRASHLALRPKLLRRRQPRCRPHDRRGSDRRRWKWRERRPTTRRVGLGKARSRGDSRKRAD